LHCCFQLVLAILDQVGRLFVSSEIVVHEGQLGEEAADEGIAAAVRIADVLAGHRVNADLEVGGGSWTLVIEALDDYDDGALGASDDNCSAPS